MPGGKLGGEDDPRPVRVERKSTAPAPWPRCASPRGGRLIDRHGLGALQKAGTLRLVPMTQKQPIDSMGYPGPELLARAVALLEARRARAVALEERFLL